MLHRSCCSFMHMYEIYLLILLSKDGEKMVFFVCTYDEHVRFAVKELQYE